MKNKENLVCIIIPVFKDFNALNKYEKTSIFNCFQVLGKYPVKFIGPDSMSWTGYESFCNRNNFSFSRINLDPAYFSDIDGYNKMLLSAKFYKLFSNFKYILIHQTDCYIFRDELEQWCSLDYDYIGAPWFTDVLEWMRIPNLFPRVIKKFHLTFKSIKQVGNGGLSLRKVSSTVNNLFFFKRWVKNWRANEDSFFSHFAGALNPFFRIPPVKTAVKFSFDACPDKALELNNNQLPFGCHAWYRNDEPHYINNFKFWESYINTDLEIEG